MVGTDNPQMYYFVVGARVARVAFHHKITLQWERGSGQPRQPVIEISAESATYSRLSKSLGNDTEQH